MRHGRSALAAAAVLLAVATGGTIADAQAGEQIERYDVDVVVQPDATLAVTEQIRYDFGANEHHGIFRDIPVRFEYDNRHERLTEIDQARVTALPPGTPAALKVEQAGRSKRFRIGDPKRTITGVHDYTISYRVRGALNSFPEHEELYWNATGNDWQVPIGEVTVQVHAPGGTTQVACFAGPRGSQLPCDSAGSDGGPTSAFRDGELSSGEGVTVVVGMAKGTVTVPPPILDERWSFGRAFALTPATGALSGALLVAVVAGLVRVLGRGRDRRYVGSPVDAAFGNVSGQEEAVPLFERSSDPVELEPPDKIRPGQVGTLIDEVANPLDVTATIIDLAVRGYLRIEEVPKKGWLGKTDWRLVKLRDADGLLAYERKLLDGLFRDGEQVELSDLKRKFAERLHGVEDALYDDAVSAGWFAARPDRVRLKWRVIGALALALAGAVTVVLAVVSHWALLGLPLVVGGLGLLIGARRAPRRTPKGWGVLRRVSGFRRFIEESEKERARFAERANLFSEYLPYAVVFGCTDKWAKAFAGLDDQVAAATSGWYVSPYPFMIGSFSDSMDSFAVTTSGTIVATAASSGSSGFGGGSSGGGFGGGGGGSW